MATEWQNPPDADVILRASGGKEFHAHKLILSLASPVFRDMFSTPQPPGVSSQTPILDVGDPPDVLGIFLQVIYPFRNPSIDDVETMTSLLRLADKYDAKVALDVHKDCLSSMCINSPPIHVYAVLCACGRETEAQAVGRRVSFPSLAYLNSSPLLHFITAEHYQRLIKFMTVRDQRMREIVGRHRSHIADHRHSECGSIAHALTAVYVVDPIQAAFEADPCIRVVEALGLVTRATDTFTFCSSGSSGCKHNVRGLREYAEGLLKELVEMAGSLPWGD